MLEEHAAPAEPCVAEIEHRGAAPAGPAEIRRAGDRFWIGAPGGETYASIALTMQA